MFEAILNSFLLVATSELGDKTMLLTLLLTARFGHPGMVMAGVFVGALLNHGLAALTGSYIGALIDPNTLRWVLGATFIAFGVWILMPEKEESEEITTNRGGAFLTTALTFFLAEMGDKTQLATVALAAKYKSIPAVLTGTVLAMMFVNGLAVIFGKKVTTMIPMVWIHRAAATMFFLFGALVIAYGSP